jgi:hypothetical protein
MGSLVLLYFVLHAWLGFPLLLPEVRIVLASGFMDGLTLHTFEREGLNCHCANQSSIVVIDSISGAQKFLLVSAITVTVNVLERPQWPRRIYAKIHTLYNKQT